MLEIASTRVTDLRVRFVQADLFKWRPDRRYDAVFFGFGLDGSQFMVVKVPHEPKRLQRRIANLGWNVTVTRTSGPFYWGVATPADSQ
jgi:hypothetical protein